MFVSKKTIGCAAMWTLAALLMACAAFAFDPKGEIFVYSGAKARDNCPVTVAIPGDSPLLEAAKSGQPLQAVCGDQSAPVAVLPASNGLELGFVVNGMKAWETRIYQIVAGEAYAADPVAFKEGKEKIEITIGGKPFTTYDWSTVEGKKMWPIFYPLFGPDGQRMTRGFPMEKFEGEREDHPHHQSLWVSHGDINGVNFWNMTADHGYTKQKGFSYKASPAAGRLCSHMDWTDHEGVIVFEEERIVTIWGTPESGRMIDFDMTFKANEGDVKFGDTKEGGLIALRVAATMREKQDEGVPGGTITNSAGGVGSGECWGKPAPWCDYSGPVGDLTAGLTIMDSPANPLYPMRYHVRDYGLFGANPFGLSYFIDKTKDGSRVLKKGESWHMRFRVYIHAGDAKAGRVAEAYENFADAPLVKVQ
ncbi:MAG: PmoA family protein [Candidatus Omnitrophica bacterium]|nr:PmoA family protein [Candidatus Omnitrophota bacterium]